MKTVRNISSILEEVTLRTENGKEEKIKIIKDENMRPYYPSFRFKLDLSDDTQKKKVQQLNIYLKRDTNFSIQVKIDDLQSDTNRPLYQNKIRQMGKPMILEKSKKGLVKDFYVSFRQEIFSEEDETKDCQNYPYKSYISFASCDDAYVQQRLPKDIAPIWATQNMDKVTNLSHIVTQVEKNVLEGLFTGIIQSDCPVPCTSTSIRTLDGPVTSLANPAKNEVSMISISFDPKVIITKNIVDTIGFMTCLNFLGSNLGLWPGLGIYQMLEWTVGFFE